MDSHQNKNSNESPNGKLESPNGKLESPNGKIESPNGEVESPQKELLQPGEDLAEQGQSVGIVKTEHLVLFAGAEKLQLECGKSLGPITVAYETYGCLNENRDNAILLLHALSGDAHLAGRHHVEDRKPGWWDNMIGPGKPFDTDKYFIIGTNCLGGCMGTTGPSSVNPETQKPFGLSFPMITIGDMVEVQRHLIDYLGIDKLLAVGGGSMGGMQALDWTIRYPERVAATVPIATTPRLSAQGIAFNAVGRNAISRDENYLNGNYYTSGKFPTAGLAVARMVGHITYLSEEAMHAKFGRRLQHEQNYKYDFASEFSVETYLDHQGSVFVDRFDANTYLYFSKAMDYFDLARNYSSLTEALSRAQSRFLVISYKSDWLFPARQSRQIVNALLEAGKDVTYCNIDCPFGHDSFLLETKVQGRLIRGFLAQTHQKLIQKSTNQTTLTGPAEPSVTTSTESGITTPVESGVTTPVKSQAQANNHAKKPVRVRGSIFSGTRVDHSEIEHLIKSNSTVLDLGCGDGRLLAQLQREKNIHGIGYTLNENDIQACTERGVNVVEYDMHSNLDMFDDKSFDYVVLSQTLQVIRQPKIVLRELLRIGKKVIVSFPNFAFWRGRLQIMFKGRAPVWKGLPYAWFDKPSESINYMSLSDFEDFVHNELSARLVRRIPLSTRLRCEVRVLPNLIADEVIFVIADKNHS
ncbi:MAG: homoserine O-acetyltransferase [Sedimentisphaerales bacterium]|nr:homoserine O-acetyltransferase [Sedimentisphaerales bacterium]